MFLYHLLSFFFEFLLFFQKLFVLFLFCLADLEVLNSRVSLFLVIPVTLHLADFLVDIIQLFLDLVLLFLEQGYFLCLPILIEIDRLQLLVLCHFELAVKNVVVNVTLPDGQRLQQLVLHIDRHVIQFPL